MIPDTMPWDPEARRRPLPTSAVATAQRCAARWAAPTGTLREFGPLFALYLEAGRDSDAAVLLRRRLAAVDPKQADVERTAIIDSVVGIYLQAQPVRLAAAESLLSERARHKADRLERLKIYVQLMGQAAGVHDTARARRAAQQVVAIADSLTPAERESEEFQESGGPFTAYMMAWSTIVGDRVLLDSLRRSTAAYMSLLRSMWARWSKRRPELIDLGPLGEKAPPITADFWFPQDSARHLHPTPGHVALVVFLDRTRCVDGIGHWLDFASTDRRDEWHQCWAAAVNLRRLAERFPPLEITVVSRTYGYFMYAPPLSPAEEAAYSARWMAGHGIPGTLAVSTTAFGNLNAPDGRRIDKPDSNATRYDSGSKQSRGCGSHFYLVDQDGMIVDYQCGGVEYLDNSGPGFDQLSQKIDALLHRSEGGASRAAR
ncbi:MAG: hypothetical protein IRY91_11315 [Gemmatimonadaceae bacterium]|nr:hypothetical protein [Gemmatimonadaceae bacterium]